MPLTPTQLQRFKRTTTNKKLPKWLKRMWGERAQKWARWREEGTPFPVGQKKVFLPNFTISLLRTPTLSPYWAKFQVPLYFNKLDIRDYLFHAYNVRIHAVRSRVLGSRPIFLRPGHPKWLPGRKAWYRPQSRKLMTVELEKPFIWPKEPKNFKAWEKRRAEGAYKDQGIDRKSNKPGPPKDHEIRNPWRERAQKLLNGETL